jgi:hypothetical protein
MSKLGKRLIANVQEAREIARAIAEGKPLPPGAKIHQAADISASRDRPSAPQDGSTHKKSLKRT